MPMNRRAFLGSSTAALGLGLGTRELGATSSHTSLSPDTRDPSQTLRILVLGGTGFIGPHQVRYALDRGHTVTLFNRGRTNSHLFPGVEKLVGDRDGGLDPLRGRQWDVVLDNSGYEPRIVRDSARLLADAVGQYLFVSTQSVYADRSIIDQDETGAVGMADRPEEEWEGYGPLKALCEREVQEVFSDRATIVRPPVIVGPGDGSDRFTYWVDRIHRGGEVLAPGSPDDPTQFVDVRDLTHWMVRCLRGRSDGRIQRNGSGFPPEHGRNAVRHPSRDELSRALHLGRFRVSGRAPGSALFRHAAVDATHGTHRRFLPYERIPSRNQEGSPIAPWPRPLATPWRGGCPSPLSDAESCVPA